jgi:hypothetical protein
MATFIGVARVRNRLRALCKESEKEKVRTDGRAFRRSAFPSLYFLHDRVRRMPGSCRAVEN